MASQHSDFVLHSVSAACMTSNNLGLIEHACVVVRDGYIVWVGEHAALPAAYAHWPEICGGGRLLTPALTDCHTHLVWAGSRASEFRERLHGASYEDIAAAGGGILSTVKATRAATEDELFKVSVPRAKALLHQGVAHIEIKSGYGLSLADEIKQLRVARRIGQVLPLKVSTTLLAAHALPPEFSNDSDGYIQHVCEHIIPAAAAENLADAVDVFCENIGFSRSQTERVFAAAKAHGLPVKIHAEQLSDQDGSALMAEYQGLSADHLEYLSEQGIAAMAASGSVAVLLPGAFYFLRETKLPPIKGLRAAGVPIAIATDANPGSSPLIQLPLMMHMACSLFRLTPEEAWLGVTRNAALALGDRQQGTLAEGQRADLALWNLSSPEQICYEFGMNPLEQLWINGVAV